MPDPNLLKPSLKILKPILETWLDRTKRKPEKTDFAKWNRLLAKTLTENIEASFRDSSQFEKKLAKQKIWADFGETKTWKLPPLKMPNFIEPKTLLKTETLICKTRNANLKTKLILKKPT